MYARKQIIMHMHVHDCLGFETGRAEMLDRHNKKAGMYGNTYFPLYTQARGLCSFYTHKQEGCDYQ